MMLLLTFVAIPGWLTASAAAGQPGDDPKICDAAADYALGIEDYPAAIRLHLAVLKRSPDNALAHYHLGFAYGMAGRGDDEIREYERAAALGLRMFDLYLNLGVARFEHGDPDGAVWALLTASRLTDGPEPHFELALIYEKRADLARAEAQIDMALAKSPADPDYLNTLATISAERGNLARARAIWTAITASNPDYQPASMNLQILTARPSAHPNLQVNAEAMR